MGEGDSWKWKKSLLEKAPETLDGLGNEVMQEPSVTICLRGLRKANCEAGWGILVNVWLHITHILTPTWFICCVSSEIFEDVVVYLPAVGLYRKTCVNCCGLFWFVGGARFLSGGLYQMFFSTRTYSRFFWLFFLLNNLSTFLSHVLPHSSVSALSRSCTRCCMRCRCVVWGHIYVSHNKVTMTRPLREAAMFRWLIKICWMITWSSCVS